MFLTTIRRLGTEPGTSFVDAVFTTTRTEINGSMVRAQEETPERETAGRLIRSIALFGTIFRFRFAVMVVTAAQPTREGILGLGTRAPDFLLTTTGLLQQPQRGGLPGFARGARRRVLIKGGLRATEFGPSADTGGLPFDAITRITIRMQFRFNVTVELTGMQSARTREVESFLRRATELTTEAFT